MSDSASTTQVIRRAHQTMILPARQRGERRGKPRVQPVGELQAIFSHDDQNYSAVIRDVSKEGARLSTELGGNRPLASGTVLELAIRTSWETVLRKGRVTWTKLAGTEFHFGVEYVELPKNADCIGLLNMDRIKIDPGVALRLPAQLALRRQMLPFAVADGKVHVACLNPYDAAGLQAVEKYCSGEALAEAAEPESLVRALDRVYSDTAIANGTPKRSSVDMRSSAEPGPEEVVGLCDELLQTAILRQASDIHLDPQVDGLQVRFRVDGALELHRQFPVALSSALISRYKVLCGMDIAEKRAPQDGSFKHRFGRAGQTIDLRVATLPTKYGERMTVRLLTLQTDKLTLERLGMLPRDLAIFNQYIDKPHGMILLTGPTGSGKSTTLYAAIRCLLEKEALNVITVEDPIEYEIKGVAQVEVDSADKVTFVKALRSVLRHDPDVVMIGEIRDGETADVAIKASLTGHLVFSTLHTNSAVSVITRLADMGVDRYLIAATLRMAVAQRLVRQLCPRCRKPYELTASEAASLNNPAFAGRTVYAPGSCVYCGGRGFIGRMGLFEMLALDEEWSRCVAQGVEEPDLVLRMRESKVPTLLDDGVEKILSGATSVREVVGAVSVW